MRLLLSILLASPLVFSSCTGSTYSTSTLKIHKLTDNTYIHESFLETESFGRVSCNGLLHVRDGKAVLLDTPATKDATSELLDWTRKELEAEIETVVPTHFHEDCLGGLETAHLNGIASLAHEKTNSLAAKNGRTKAGKTFTSEYVLPVGNKSIYLYFPGEGHTEDNIVAYLPDEKILFGGCLIKSLGATKGNLEDANTAAWPQTISNLQSKFPDIITVVPGHNSAGGTDLLNYTGKLFSDYSAKP